MVLSCGYLTCRGRLINEGLSLWLELSSIVGVCLVAVWQAMVVVLETSAGVYINDLDVVLEF